MTPDSVRTLLGYRGIRLNPDDSLFSLLLLNDWILERVTRPGIPVQAQHVQQILQPLGWRISDDDPLLILLNLNDIVLRNALERLALTLPKESDSAKTGRYVKALGIGLFGLFAGLIIAFGQTNLTFMMVGIVSLVLGGAMGALVRCLWCMHHTFGDE